jgi:hypothetical protein
MRYISMEKFSSCCWRFSSVAEDKLSMQKDLGSICSTKNRKRKKSLILLPYIYLTKNMTQNSKQNSTQDSTKEIINTVEKPNN